MRDRAEAAIRQVLVDFLDWEDTVYPDLGLTADEANRDYDMLTDAIVQALHLDGQEAGS